MLRRQLQVGDAALFVLAETRRKLRVVTIRTNRQQLLRPRGSLFGVVQRRQVMFFDECGVVGLQSRGKSQSKQRVLIFVVLAEPGVRELFRTVDGCLELTVQRWIRAERRTVGEGFVILVELSLENSQPVELREQKSRRGELTGPTGSSGCCFSHAEKSF